MLGKLLGLRVDEMDGLSPDRSNSIVMKDSGKGMRDRYGCAQQCDIVRLLPGAAARALAVFGSDFYAGSPVVTENRVGKGLAYYIATVPEQAFLNDFFQQLCAAHDVAAPCVVPPGVEATRRVRDGRGILFLLNHNERQARVDLGKHSYVDASTGSQRTGRVDLPAKGVLVLRED